MSNPTDEIKTYEDAEKLFAEAFREGLGDKGSSVHSVVTESTHTEEDKPSVDTATETTPTVVEDKKDEKPAEQSDNTAKQTVEAKPVRNDIPEWARDLSPEVQDKLASTISYHVQRYNSDIGRQSAYQRQLREANRRIAELAAQVTKPQDPNLAAAAKKDALRTSEEWNQLNEADPSLAKAVEARVAAEREAQEARIAGLEAKLQATAESAHQQSQNDYLDKQHKILLDAVPNYQEVAAHPVYAYWINQKASPGIRQLANTSSEAADAITVFQMYAQQAEGTYKEMVSKGLLKAEPDATPTKEVPATTVQSQSTTDAALADQVAKSRENKMQSAPPVKQQPSAVAAPRVNALSGSKPGDSIDYTNPDVEALFADAFNKSIRR